MTDKHTPGPWKASERTIIQESTDESKFRYITFIATVYKDHDPEANARLIATAPELLEALIWLVHLMHNIGKSGGPPSDGEYEEAGNFAKAAIEKATKE